MKKTDTTTEHIPTAISACCILHNICKIHGEAFNEAWLHEVDDSDDEIEHAQPRCSSQQRCQSTADNVCNTVTILLCSAIIINIVTNNSLRTCVSVVIRKWGV